MADPAITIGAHLFSPDALARALASVPEPTGGKKNALVGTVDSSGAKVALVMTFSDAWEVEAAVQHDWTGDTTVGAKVIGRW